MLRDLLYAEELVTRERGVTRTRKSKRKSQSRRHQNKSEADLKLPLVIRKAGVVAVNCVPESKLAVVLSSPTKFPSISPPAVLPVPVVTFGHDVKTTEFPPVSKTCVDEAETLSQATNRSNRSAGSTRSRGRSRSQSLLRSATISAIELNGICAEESFKKDEFLEKEWRPFLATLDYHLNEVKRKRELGYLLEDRLPPQETILHLADHCLELTKRWYGPKYGNLSALFVWFVSASEEAGVSVYRYKDLPIERSKDSFVLAIDGVARGKYLKMMKERNDNHVALGGWRQQQGESAIDNTVLVNVLSPVQAHVLLAGMNLRAFIVKCLQIWQKRHLKRIGSLLSRPEDFSIEAITPASLKANLEGVSSEELMAAGIHVERSISYQLLAQTGGLIENWGQLPADRRRAFHELITAYYTTRAEAQQSKSQRRWTKIYSKFTQFVSEHPGTFFTSKKLHSVYLLSGMWKGDVAVVKRSTMEQVTVARYLPVRWVRRCDLQAYDSRGGKARMVRAAGSDEASRFRLNEAPYLDSHGMSISSGGLYEGSEVHATLAYDLAAPLDPSARVENWGLIDIEKLLKEVRFLNPRARNASELLEGEQYHDCGQNPRVGSSIRNTQHMQISRAWIELYPVYQLSRHPQRCLAVNGLCDIVQVGQLRDACFVKFIVPNPTYRPLLDTLIDLRGLLLSRYGPNGVDFNVKACGDRKGAFIIIFTVLAQLRQEQDKSYTNPDSGANSSSMGSAIPYIDTGKGCGQILVSDMSQWEVLMRGGKEQLSKVYDLCAKPGSRAVVSNFLKERIGYEDEGRSS
mmetsp:Transcript_4826/g.7519  ORF Transcript_4826/g.7519 Transcript_4826/m.7519 type:complete len:802 (-) Transcript_4826:399-2804(-)